MLDGFIIQPISYQNIADGCGDHRMIKNVVLRHELGFYITFKLTFTLTKFFICVVVIYRKGDFFLFYEYFSLVLLRGNKTTKNMYI